MQDTSDKLLDLAESEVCSRGYNAVSYGDLAKLAGIRKASIHHHYPAKADLGTALVDRFANRLSEQLATHSARARTGREALRSYIDDCRFACGDGQSTSLLVALSGDAVLLHSDMRAALAKAQAMVVEWLSRTLQRGRQDRSISVSGIPDEEAASAYAMLCGAQLCSRAARDLRLFDLSIATLTSRMSRH